MGVADSRVSSVSTDSEVTEMIAQGLSEQQWMTLLVRSYELDTPMLPSQHPDLPIAVILKAFKTSETPRLVKRELGSHPSLTTTHIEELYYKKTHNNFLDVHVIAAWEKAPAAVLRDIFETHGKYIEPGKPKEEFRVKESLDVLRLARNHGAPVDVLTAIIERCYSEKTRNAAIHTLRDVEYPGYPVEWVSTLFTSV